MQFPALVYRGTGGKEFTYKPVDDQAEHAAALAAGWFATVPEALAPPAPAAVIETPAPVAAEPIPEPVPAAPAELAKRAELERQATELGVKFGPLIGDAKLAARIEEAQKARG